MSKLIQIRLDDSLVDLLDSKCSGAGLDRSNYIKVLIAKGEIVYAPNSEPQKVPETTQTTQTPTVNPIIDSLKSIPGITTADKLADKLADNTDPLWDPPKSVVDEILNSSASGVRKMYLLQARDTARFNEYVKEYCFKNDIEVENLPMNEMVAKEILGMYMPKIEVQEVKKEVDYEQAEREFNQVFFNEGNEIEEFKGSAWKEPKKKKKGGKK